MNATPHCTPRYVHRQQYQAVQYLAGWPRARKQIGACHQSTIGPGLARAAGSVLEGCGVHGGGAGCQAHYGSSLAS